MKLQLPSQMKYATILFVLTAHISSHGQDMASAKLAWNSVSTHDPSTSTTVNEITQLFTYGSDSIRWVQGDATIRRFAIVATNGSWHDVSQPGRITFEIDNRGFRDVISIARDAADTNNIKVRLILTGELLPVVTELTITSIESF